MAPCKEVILDGNSMPLREFKMEYMCPSPSICMVAKRGSGKSIVCRDILAHFRHLPGGIIISPTEKNNSFYGHFFPDTFIHHAYSSVLIDKLLARQSAMITKMKENYKKHRKCDPRVFIVMDDCMASKGEWVKEPGILELFFNGRHSQIMYILTMQFPLGISPDMRANFDYIFLLSDDTVSNQKKLFDHYAGVFPNVKSFISVFQQITKDYGCLVLVKRSAGDEFLDKVFWYKADYKRKMKAIGCEQFKQFHMNNYDPNWNKRTQFKMDEFLSGKSKSIRVAKLGADS